MEPTYAKRAQGLVKKGRAAWLSEGSIRLSRRPEEDNIMDSVFTEAPLPAGAAETQLPAAEAPALDDAAILDLAKRHLAAKRNLIGQALDFLLILFCAFLFIAMSDISLRIILAFFLCAFWGIRLLVRVIKFAKPSLKGGVAEYFRKRREQKLAFECDRIRKMGTEYVVSGTGGK